MADKVINTIETLSPVPKTGRETYLMPFIKKAAQLSGGNFRLSDILDPIDEKAKDVDAALDEIGKQIREIAVKKTASGNPLIIEDSLDAPIVEATFGGGTTGGKSSPIVNASIDQIVLDSRTEQKIIRLPELIFLAKHDALVLKDSLAQIERGDIQRTLTGDEAWQSAIQSGGNGRIIRYKVAVPDAYSTTGRVEVLSDRFTYRGGVASDEGTVFISGGEMYVYPNPSLDSVDAFKQFLRQNPTIVQYQLARPTLDDVSAEAQAALSQMQTFMSYTKVTSSATTQTISYLASTKDYIDDGDKKNAAAIAQNTANIANKADKTSVKDLRMLSDTLLFQTDSDGFPIPSQVAHVHVDKPYCEGALTFEGKEIPEGTTDFTVEPKDMANDGVILENKCPFNTDEYAERDATMSKYPFIEGHKYYTRVTAKLVGARKPDYETFVFIKMIQERKILGTTVFLNEFSGDTEYTKSQIYSSPKTAEAEWDCYIYSSVSGGNVRVQSKHVMLIDITALAKMFPSYTDEQLKNLCDVNIPYISAQQSQFVNTGIVFKNVCEDNTDTWTSATDISYKSFAVTESKYSKWYIRVDAKQTRGANDTQIVLAINGDRKVFQKNAVQNQSYTLSTYYKGAFNINPVGVLTLDTSSGGRNAGLSVQHVVTIDITDLSARYPQYSDEQLKAILDASLPYISAQQSKTLGGVVRLENLVPNPTSTDGWTAGSAVTDFSIQDGVVKGTVSQSLSYSGNYWMFKEVSDYAKLNTYFVKVNNIFSTGTLKIGYGYKVLTANRNYGYTKYGLDRSANVLSVGSGASGQTTISIKPVDGILLVDTTSSLLDLWLSLQGYDTDEKKADWCNRHIPSFEGTFDLVLSMRNELTITAKCDGLTKAITFKKAISDFRVTSVVESGEGYQKFADGTLIQWGRVETAVESSGNRSSLNQTTLNCNQNFPVPFTKTPYVVMTADDTTDFYGFVVAIASNTTSIRTAVVYDSVSIRTGAIYRASWTAIGRWK